MTSDTDKIYSHRFIHIQDEHVAMECMQAMDSPWTARIT